jgi:hypothetical protein
MSQKDRHTWSTHECCISCAFLYMRKSTNLLHHACPLVSLHVLAWLPLDSILLNLILESLIKICVENRNLVTIGQMYQELHMKIDLYTFYCCRRHKLAIKAFSPGYEDNRGDINIKGSYQNVRLYIHCLSFFFV